jgi:hypothetical protein
MVGLSYCGSVLRHLYSSQILSNFYEQRKTPPTAACPAQEGNEPGENTLIPLEASETSNWGHAFLAHHFVSCDPYVNSRLWMKKRMSIAK